MQKLGKRGTRVFVLGLLILFIVTLFFRFNAAAPPSYDVARKVQYGFTLTNETNYTKKDFDFYVSAPVKLTSSQMFDSIQASLPYDLVVDEFGNQLIHFRIDALPPFASKVISVSAQLKMASAPNRIDLLNDNTYISAEKNIESDNEKIIDFSKQFKSDSHLQSAEKLLRWVSTNIKYSGYIKEDKGALYALKNRTGDCTEYMDLYIAGARALGIPSRGIAGYITSEDAVFKPADFHNWSEIYLDGKWRVVDPQNGKFLEEDAHYIAMRILSAKSESMTQLNNSQQFAVVHGDVHVKMD